MTTQECIAELYRIAHRYRKQHSKHALFAAIGTLERQAFTEAGSKQPAVEERPTAGEQKFWDNAIVAAMQSLILVGSEAIHERTDDDGEPYNSPTQALYFNNDSWGDMAFDAGAIADALLAERRQLTRKSK